MNDYTAKAERNPFNSASLEHLLNTIHADGTVNLQEYRAIARDADERIERLIDLLGTPNSNLTAYMSAMDVTMHLLQLAVLQAMKVDLTDTGEAIVRDALIAQVEYLKAGAHLLLRML